MVCTALVGTVILVLVAVTGTRLSLPCCGESVLKA